jgi:protein phosphatase
MTAPFSLSFHVAVWAMSDVGLVRENNEDAFAFDESLRIYVVCDGMGGLDCGEEASSRAAAAILSSFRTSTQTEATVSARLQEAVEAANHDAPQTDGHNSCRRRYR